MNPSQYNVAWNSVQSAPYYYDTASYNSENNYQLDAMRHYYPGPDAHDWTDIRPCGKDGKKYEETAREFGTHEDNASVWGQFSSII